MAKREIGIDNIKVIACILVVLGHFNQSMIKSDIINNYEVLKWFEETIYMFHVPLFFICSGYIYQRFGVVNSFQTWTKNVTKKLIVLGVPYITFSVITWFLKNVFSKNVNEDITSNLLETLILSPTSPYWYLYTLFLIFVITPTFQKRVVMFSLSVFAIILKGINIIGINTNVFAINSILANEIWFVLGMVLSFIKMDSKIKEKKLCSLGMVGICVFILLSAIIYVNDVSFKGLSFIMGILACLSIFIAIHGWYYKYGQNYIMDFLAKYTMPIFLMHTIFAAPLRVVLLKLGIQNAFIHVMMGVAISIIGPVIAMLIMKRFKWMEFFIYPRKYIKL